MWQEGVNVERYREDFDYRDMIDQNAWDLEGVEVTHCNGITTVRHMDEMASDESDDDDDSIIRNQTTKMI